MSSPVYLEIKGSSLYYSIDEAQVSARNGLTLTFGLSAFAAQELHLNLKSNLLKLSGNVVIIGESGAVFRGQQLILDCNSMIGYLSGENSTYLTFTNQIIPAEKPARFPDFAEATFLSVPDIGETQIYVSAPRLRYYPDRQIRFWRGNLVFEGDEAGQIPYLALKIGRLPPPNGFILKNLAFRSNSGIDLAFGYNYLVNDRNYGTVFLGGRRFSFSGNDEKTALGELGLDHSFRWQENRLDIRTYARTDQEFFQTLKLFLDSFQFGSYNLNLDYSQFGDDFDRQNLELGQQLSWNNGRTLSLKNTHNLENEWSTAFGYKENILRNLVGRLELNYYANQGTASITEHSRVRGEMMLEWRPQYFFTGLQYSREEYFPDDFATERSVLTFRTNPIYTADRLLSLSIMNTFSLKRLLSQLSEELFSDTMYLVFQTATLALASKTFLDIESGVTQHWENEVQQDTYFDLGALLTQHIHKRIQAGMRYNFLTKRDTESPWLIRGYHNQTGSIFVSVGDEKKYLAGVSLEYDLTNDEFISETTRCIFFWGPFLKFELLGEYNALHHDWVRADLMISRDLHFSEIKVVWRQVTETFYIEFVSRL
ncbi:hypothetical protein ACFL27_09500 [candidate division CSSED10-310 bacterium]|uniref:LPS-assembly protein LptD n=1 Tax=candidate division CSSED10-310 bacterium TaxID=2855610 RepID=A0ABV6YW51_UNCC1